MTPDDSTEDHTDDPRTQSWFLAFYGDGSGLWGVGFTWMQAQARAYQFWVNQTEGEPPCSREEWLADLICVEVRTCRQGLDLLLEALPSADDLPIGPTGEAT